MGRFEGGAWRVRLVENPTGMNPLRTDRELIRELGASEPQVSLPNRAEVRQVILDQVVYDLPPYNRSVAGFRNYLEGWIGPPRPPRLHNAVHIWVGGDRGDMGDATSPNDPVFFLHHCNVDRLWALWQLEHPGDNPRREHLGKGLNYFKDMTVADTLNVTDLGYDYAVAEVLVHEEDRGG